MSKPRAAGESHQSGALRGHLDCPSTEAARDFSARLRQRYARGGKFGDQFPESPHR